MWNVAQDVRLYFTMGNGSVCPLCNAGTLYHPLINMNTLIEKGYYIMIYSKQLWCSRCGVKFHNA